MNAMNTWMKRLITIAAAVLLASSLAVSQAFAATGNQGYAVYRDGVAGNLNWHAAIMDDPHWNTTGLPVIQHSGSGYVKWDTWANFIAGETYMGTWKPKGSPTSANRDLFKSRARFLKDEQIPYTVYHQVDYNVSTSGTWVDLSEITKIRCDGVIEYTYEWYGFRVYGGDSDWDVTKVGSANRSRHYITNIGPKGQTSYLTKVTSSLP